MLSSYNKWLCKNPDNQKAKLPKSFLYSTAKDREQQGQEVVTHLPDIRLKTGVLPSFVRLASLVVYRKELLMAERKREIQVKFWITPEEKKMIRKKMILSRTANMGAYLRKMAIDGIIVNTDTTYLEKQFLKCIRSV